MKETSSRVSLRGGLQVIGVCLRTALFGFLVMSPNSCSTTATKNEKSDLAAFRDLKFSLRELLKHPKRSGFDFESREKQLELEKWAQKYIHAKSNRKSKQKDEFLKECITELSEGSFESEEIVGPVAQTGSEEYPKEYIAKEYIDDQFVGPIKEIVSGQDFGDETGNAEKALFCQSFQKSTQQSRTSQEAKKSSVRRQIKSHLEAIRRALASGNLEAIIERSEVEIISTLKHLPTRFSLDRAYEKAMSTEDCLSPQIRTSLALKTEEDFPEETAVRRAMALHSKAVECGLKEAHSSAIKSAYRLGLIHIWKGQWEPAQELYSQLLDTPASPTLQDFRLRLLYWSAQIEKAIEKDESAGQEYRDLLSKEFPLSLHALLMESAPNLKLKLADVPEDQSVLFRTSVVSELNDIVRTVEAIQRVAPHQPEMARQFLTQGLTKIDSTEVGFQVYYGVLLHRARESIQKFQLIANVMKKDRKMFTKATLALLYPLDLYEEVERQAREKTDPFLVLSLIRQESAFNERARSRVGAVGLMQVMPMTARRVERGMTVKKLYEPDHNLRIGIQYLASLTRRYEGDAELVLAAYNAGPGRVDRWRNRYPTENRLLFLDLIPIKETREYVASIARNYYWYASLYPAQSRVTRQIASASKPSGAGGRDPRSANEDYPKLSILDSVWPSP